MVGGSYIDYIAAGTSQRASGCLRPHLHMAHITHAHTRHLKPCQRAALPPSEGPTRASELCDHPPGARTDSAPPMATFSELERKVR